MSILNSDTEQFVKELNYAQKAVSVPAEGELFHISKTASNLAIIYESVRNAIEFRADHLVRQSAIERILKRRIFLNQSGEKLATALLKELLWARYLKEDAVPVAKINGISQIIERYLSAIRQTPSGLGKSKGNHMVDWFISLAACEIEEKLVFNPRPQILINYVYSTLLKVIEFNEPNPRTRSFQIYIAVERGFAQNSEIYITYRLLKRMVPEWFKQEGVVDNNLYNKLLENRQIIITELNNPVGIQLRRTVIKMMAPFNLIRDLSDEYRNEFETLISNREELEKKSALLLDKRYRQTKDKLIRASRRSIVYIFLTKMALALILELPFDILLGSISYTALAINALFPPVMMFLLNAKVKVPDKKNTVRMIGKIEEYFYGQGETKKVVINRAKTRSLMDWGLFIFYLAMYLMTFGLILYVLNSLHFNPISQLIFIFFLTVVCFFAYRIRQITKDYYLEGNEKEVFRSIVFDFIFLPIIKVGQWLSIQISAFNFLTAIFDFIIEAPFKALLGIIEEWIHFVRTKKEEIVT